MATLDDPDTPDQKRAAMARALASAGLGDVLQLRRETAQTALTEKRREILRHLRDDRPDSVRALARELDRDKAAVSRDLQVLTEYDVVAFDTDGVGNAPRLKHDTVVVEPIV